MNEDLETIIREVYSCYGVRYGNAIVDLKQRIDKAIEYIEQYKLHPRLRTQDSLSLQERQLLDILKGSDSDGYNKE